MAPERRSAAETSPSLFHRLGEVMPLSGIAPGDLEALASESRPLRLREGQRPEEGPLVVLSGGLRIIDDEGRSVDVVGAGELWVPAEGTRGEALVDTEIVVLPERTTDLAWTGVDVATLIPAPELRTPLSGHVDALMLPVTTVEASTPSSVVAQQLAAEPATAIIVELPEGLGIVTDRDIRARLVAEGRSTETPVGEITTHPLVGVRPGSSLSDAVRTMVDEGVNHLPVIDAGTVVGILQSNRLLSTVSVDSLGIRTRITEADVTDLETIHRGFPKLAADLLASGMDAVAVLESLSGYDDAITSRVIELTPPPPGSFAWVALGSQGRREQGLHTDQDHALVLGPEADDPAFAEWAASVTDVLRRVGFPLCPGGTMASEPAWRRSEDEWRKWRQVRLNDPEPRSVLDVATACDARVVAGDGELGEVFDQLRAEAGEVAPFMARIAAAATHFRVPLGFFGRVVVERSGEAEGRFDIKKGAVGPITILARVLGLAAGSESVSTLARLDDAESAGELSPTLADIIRHGFELAVRLRLKRHLEGWREGEPYDDRIDPDEMDGWERRLLKEVFRAVRELQGAMETRFQTGYVR